MAASRESVRGLAISLGGLWILAAVFAVVADQHYDGMFARALPPDAPRNFLDFQSRDVLAQAGVLSLALALHWLPLFRKTRTLRGLHAANVALALALAAVAVGWFDELLDDYYHTSLFCLGGRADRIWDIDVGWACEAARSARNFVLPTVTLLLLIISFVVRRTSGGPGVSLSDS